MNDVRPGKALARHEKRMANYTTLSSAALAEMLSHYAIGEARRLEEMPGGFGNSNFKLTTTAGTFLLKICDEKNAAELQMQIKLLARLQEHAYPTAYPILQKRGEAVYVVSAPTECRVMLYPFLPGGTPQLSPRVLSQIGEALAKLHRIPPIAGLPRFPMGLSQMKPFLAEVQTTPFAAHPFIDWMKSELELIVPQLNEPLPTGLLHGDVFADNTLFDGEELVAILDFEEGCHDTLLIDVGMTIIGCCYTEQHALNAEAARSFLDAYAALRRLTVREWECLDAFVRYAALAIAFWRFRQFNVRRPDARRANTYQEMITRSAAWHSGFPRCT